MTNLIHTVYVSISTIRLLSSVTVVVCTVCTVYDYSTCRIHLFLQVHTTNLQLQAIHNKHQYIYFFSSIQYTDVCYGLPAINYCLQH